MGRIIGSCVCVYALNYTATLDPQPQLDFSLDCPKKIALAPLASIGRHVSPQGHETSLHLQIGQNRFSIFLPAAFVGHHHLSPGPEVVSKIHGGSPKSVGYAPNSNWTLPTFGNCLVLRQLTLATEEFTATIASFIAV